jgi:hypothetical protein
MGIGIVRAILTLGLVLLILSVLSLAIVPPDDPGRVAALIAVAANLITIVGAGIVLGVWHWKTRKRP